MNQHVRIVSPGDTERLLERFVVRLTDLQLIPQLSIERAARAAAESHDRIDKVLVKLGLLDEKIFAESWSAVLGFDYVEVGALPTEALFPELFNERFLRHRSALIIEGDEQSLKLAVTDPLDASLIAAVEARSGRSVIPTLVTSSDLVEALDGIYPPTADEGARSGAVGAADDDVARLRDLSTGAPAIHWVNAAIERAIELQASDIHLSVGRAGPRLRYRVDGALLDETRPPAELYEAIVSRIKVLADLDISERRMPQDGRIRHAVSGREIDLRIATMPHIEGEGAVLRILDRTAVKPDLEALGLPNAISNRLTTILAEPHGIFLVTGPTGAGKTTTLYAALRRLIKPELNVLSVEDPVEYHLDGVNQIQVHRKIGLDFPTVLRAVLRQDPDIIMIGEIRDVDTASIANQAALTGHFVLSTLHTNSASAAIPRLIDMAVEPYLLSSTMRGVMSQRLVRSLCPHCASVPRPAELDALRRLIDERRLICRDFDAVRRATGCKACGNTGYKGRTAVAELVVVDETIRQAILDRTDAATIEALALRGGTQTLQDAGLLKVLEGRTSFDEVLRVAGSGAVA